jgi:hypothetical protein
VGEPALDQLQTIVEQQLRTPVEILARVELRAPRAQGAQDLHERAVASPVGDEL